jgi:iron(III) transport system substrate-binding protein
MPEKNSPSLSWAGIAALTVGLAAVLWALRPGKDALVVYCAHDAEFSEAILRQFEEQTGIPVVIRFDTEATKSLGLVNLIQAERDHPQCDVFWNNELLGSVDLAEDGMLEPYRGPGYERIPAQFKDEEGRWTGFAARLRVFIVPADREAAGEAAIEALLDSQADLSRVAIANPLFGTTLTHYTLLWQQWGEERLKAWHEDLRRRGIREVAGNSATKNLVADGACDVGFTDTDDFFVAKDAGKPVAMLPVHVGGRTICIPNTVGIIRGTRRLSAAQKLVDFLLSEETELALARSAARQIPLGESAGSLPEDVAPLAAWAKKGADLRPLLPARKSVIDWLKLESLQ